jgi:hypothetical protein
MKKVFIFFFALGTISLNANSQNLTSKKGENYLPEKGDWAIGFNADGIFEYIGNAFNGTSGNSAPSVDFQRAGTFVGKKFTSNTEAYRVIANLRYTSDKVGTGDALNSFAFTAGLGKEWRKGKTRLQGYYGADALLSLGSVTQGTNKSGLAFGVGVQGFIGAEYFILPKIAIGAQYGYGLNFSTKGEGVPAIGNASETRFGLSGVGTTSINLNLHF